MAKKILARRIPIIGKSGLLAIFGCIFGIVVDRLLENVATADNAWLRTQIYEGFHLDDLIGLIIPLILLMAVKKFRAFFIGWFIGQLASELYEWAHGTGGYTGEGISSSLGR